MRLMFYFFMLNFVDFARRKETLNNKKRNKRKESLIHKQPKFSLFYVNYFVLRENKEYERK